MPALYYTYMYVYLKTEKQPSEEFFKKYISTLDFENRYTVNKRLFSEDSTKRFYLLRKQHYLTELNLFHKFKPNKKKIYYAIAGINGYGVYTSKKSAAKSIQFLSNWRCKEFYDVEEAVKWATYTMADLNNSIISIYPITRLNWIFYKAKPRKRFVYDD